MCSRNCSRSGRFRGGGGFERVRHVEIVRPRLCPILPGMGAGIRAHELLLPLGRRTCLIVTLQRACVVVTLVTKQGSELIQVRTPLDQPRPVVVTNLVSHVSEQGAIRFSQRLAPLLPFGVVSLRDVDRDKAVRMAGQNRRVTVHGVGKKLEEQPWRS